MALKSVKKGLTNLISAHSALLGRSVFLSIERCCQHKQERFWTYTGNESSVKRFTSNSTQKSFIVLW